MKITVVGAGRVGTHLSAALSAAGHDAVLVHGRGGVLSEGCDVYIICVRDDVLPEVAARVRDVAGEALVVHTAGSVGMEVIGSTRCGVLYPMQTFSKDKAVDFGAIPLFIEANSAEALDVLARLAGSISQHVTPLSSADRRRLHVAAVFACNFVNHCVALADRELHVIGLDWRTMLPLLDETVAKLHHLSPLEGQTGPAVRGDETVMAAHEAMITDDVEREIYHIMSQSIGEMAKGAVMLLVAEVGK